jgi:hypothetical protein
MVALNINISNILNLDDISIRTEETKKAEQVKGK